MPSHLARSIAPATHDLFEWMDYWLQCPDADRLRIGDRWEPPVVPGVFRIRFENELGLARIQPFRAVQPLGPPTHVEVLRASG